MPQGRHGSDEAGTVASASADWIRLSAADDRIDEGAGFDRVFAGAGRDVIRGGSGRDSLEGGAGADQFVFDSDLSAATNIDTLLDFEPGRDQIVLDRAIFRTLNNGSRLNGAAFRAGPGVLTAATASERLLYDTSSGRLAYDADGSGTIDRPIPFAVLAGSPTLSSADFRLQGGPSVAPRTDPRPTLSVGPKLAVTVVPAAGESTSVAWNWVSAATDAVSSGSVRLDLRAGPTIAARFYAMLGTALYESWQIFDGQARSTLAGKAARSDWERELEQQIRGLLRPGGAAPSWPETPACNRSGDEGVGAPVSPLAGRLIESVMARTAHAVLSSPLSGIQVGSAGQIRLDQQLQASLAAISATDAAAFNGIDERISAVVAEKVLAAFRNDGSSLTLPSLINPITAEAPAYAPVNSGPAAVTQIDRWTPEYGVDSNPATPLQAYLTPLWGEVPYYLLPAGRIDALTASLKDPEPFLLDPRDTYDLSLGLIYDDGEGVGVAMTPDQIGRLINPAFIAQADEVVAYSRQLSEPEGNLYKGIAQFWENGGGTPFPPGTWMKFGQYASLLHDNSLADDARLFLGLGASVYTASIAAWHEKLEHDYARPIRVIRELSRLGLMQDLDQDPSNGSQFEASVRGQGLRLINGVDWETYQTPGGYSPPFAEYVSGHSTFSSASADFLTRFYDSPEFGAEVQFTLPFPYDPPGQTVTLGWDTWKGAAQEAGFSRLWGGIHFLDGNIEGQLLGSAIGSSIHQQLSQLWG